jgi:hypothetical protein
MTTMSENTIAICLYIGIMAMAGTVLVLTIVYFVRPNPAKKAPPASADAQPDIESNKPARKKLQFKFPVIKAKSQKTGKAQPAAADIKPVNQSVKPARKKLQFKFPAIKAKSQKTGKAQPAAADAKPVIESTKPARKKLQLKFPALKMKLKKTDSAVVLEKQPKMKSKEAVTPVIDINQPENLWKSVLPRVETKKEETKEKPAAPVVAAEKSQTKDVKPEIKSTAKPEIKPGTVITAQPAPAKSEKPEQPVPKEILMPVVTASLPVALPPSAEAGKPKPDAVVPIANVKEKPAAVEAVKKEPEPKMDNKNMKPVANTAAEKPPTPPVAVKTATTTAAPGPAAAKKAPEPKTSLDDFSKMFAKETVDDSEATKLAKDMKEVEVDSLLKESRDLVALLKRGRS